MEVVGPGLHLAEMLVQLSQTGNPLNGPEIVPFQIKGAVEVLGHRRLVHVKGEHRLLS